MSSPVLYDDPDFEAEMEHLMALPLAQKEAALARMVALFNTISAGLSEEQRREVRGQIVRHCGAISADRCLGIVDGKPDRETMEWSSYFMGYINGATKGCVLCFPPEETPVATRGVGGDANQQDDAYGGADEEKVADEKAAV